jgi:malonyl CoA-acyl carrier protein transacylase
MATLVALGAEGFVEIGTGRVLRGLLKTVAPEAPRHGVEDPASLAATVAALGATQAGGVA